MPIGADSRRDVVARALGNRTLRRALLAFLEFNLAELGTWVAFLVWAYDVGGIRAASLMAVVQLAPGAALAPVAASWLSLAGRGTALALGYLVQGLAFGLCGVLLAVDAPYAVVVVVSVTAGVAVTLTRPVHYALLPLVSETTEDLTAGNGLSTTTEGVAAVAGPLVSGALTGWYGPGAVLLFFAATSLVAALGTRGLVLHQAITPEAEEPETDRARASDVLRAAAHEPGAALLAGVVGAGYIVVGALDLLFVALALDVLGTDESGPGVLSAAAGAGTLIAGAATVVLLGRRRLAPAVLAAAAVICAGLSGLALVDGLALAMVLAALAETGKGFFDVTLRILTQRALPDRLLNAIFGLQESTLMAGLCLGALLAPGLVGLVGIQASFLVIATALAALVLAAYAGIRRIDARAEVPVAVVELFASIPMLRLLGQGLLERLARDARTESVPAGTQLVTQGEPGRLFFALADGSATVAIDGHRVRELGPGDYFGEIALLRDVPRTATVTAATDVTVSTIAREAFLTAVAGTPVALAAGEDQVRGYEGLD